MDSILLGHANMGKDKVKNLYISVHADARDNVYANIYAFYNVSREIMKFIKFITISCVILGMSELINGFFCVDYGCQLYCKFQQKSKGYCVNDNCKCFF
uniref:INVERT_DEFENSINS domain-containing protein n=1 Tax=Strongyloides venezuelensis TaxID=75913 RepID=A0A0K0FDW9_STRVS